MFVYKSIFNIAVMIALLLATLLAQVIFGGGLAQAAQPPFLPKLQEENVTISKDNGQLQSVPGQQTTYTIVVSNNGASEVTGATVSDDLPALLTNVSWSCVGANGATCGGPGPGDIVNDPIYLPGNSSVTYTVTATVVSSATGNLTNIASVTFFGGSSISDDDVDTLDPQADLAISKSNGQNQTVPGASTIYTIVITNTGPSDVSGATVTDNFSAKFTGVSWTCTGSGGGTCTANGADNIADTVNLPVGATVTYQATTAVSAGATGNLINTATIAVPDGVTDPGLNPNSATDTDALTPETDLTISKTNNQNQTIPGLSTTYIIVASNNGPSNAVNATVGDIFPSMSGVTWTCTGSGGGTCAGSGPDNLNQSVTLPVGGLVTFTVTGTVNRGATGELINTAIITPGNDATDPGPNPNSATDTDTLTPQANLFISKTNGQASTIPGNSTTYTLVITNSGPSNVTGATVNDTFPLLSGVTWTCNGSGGGSCPAGSGTGNLNALINVPVGGSVTFNATGQVDPAARGTLTNTATVAVPDGVTDPDLTFNSASDIDTLTPRADLAIIKSDSPNPVIAGNVLTYNISVTNNGPSEATGVTLTDNLPAGVIFQSVTPGDPICTESGGSVLCELGTIPDGDTVLVTILVQVNPGQVGALSNTAVVDGNEPDLLGGNDSDTEPTNVQVRTDLAISKAESADPVALGELLVYTLLITNNGPSNATGVTVSDNMPNSGITLQSVTPSQGSCSGTDPVNCTLGNMTSGATATVIIVVNPTSTGTLNNSATVDSVTTDPNTGNDSSGVISTTINRVTDLALTMTASPDPITAGNDLTYNLTVANNGPSTATTVTMTHTLPADVTFLSANPGGPTCTHAGGLVTCKFNSMAQGSSMPVAVMARVNEGTAGYITSTASVTATSSTGPDIVSTTTFVGVLNKVYLPFLEKPAPTELSVFNDNTGGNVTLTVVGTGVSCSVPNNTTKFCGSFQPGTYTVQVTSACGNATVSKTYASGPQTTRIFCN